MLNVITTVVIADLSYSNPHILKHTHTSWHTHTYTHYIHA